MAFVCAVPGVSFGVVVFICFGVWLDAGCGYVSLWLLGCLWRLGIWVLGWFLDGAVVGCCEFRVWLDWFPVYFGFVALL